MTIRQDDGGAIVLEGDCPVEEAETLLERLQARPDATVDWSACTRLHTAVIQVLMAAQARIRGPCGDAFVRAWDGLRPAAPDEGSQRR
jgi:hypothetical protein